VGCQVKKYRIVEYIGYKNKTYKVQKKSIFGFWYNYENIDAFSTGVYNNIEDAEESIFRHAHKGDKLIKRVYDL